jgi:hypothetical protein
MTVFLLVTRHNTRLKREVKYGTLLQLVLVLAGQNVGYRFSAALAVTEPPTTVAACSLPLQILPQPLYNAVQWP